jgi:hypothetical protein
VRTVVYASLFAGGLLVGMLLCLEIGRRIGVRRMARDVEGSRAGVGVVDGAVFALLGLLIAFTFSGAATRFDTRRHLIVEEANAIGTAYLRLDLLPAAAQPALRDAFRRYVDGRLEVYRVLPDIEAARAALARSAVLHGEIWRQAVDACAGQSDRSANMLVLPALNQMIDITTTRTVAAETHPPAIIYALLAALVLISALLAGYDMAGGKTRNWVHMTGFALIMAAAIYVILDLECPRLGWIRIDAVDQLLVDVRENMK